MERFSVSGEDLRNFYTPQTTLAKVFSDIERELQSQNQVVCQYVLNGLALSEKQEGQFANLELAQVESLEYLAEDSQLLQKSVTQSWIQALPELISEIEKLSAKIRQEGLVGNYKAAHDVMENTEFLISSVSTLKSLVGDGVMSTYAQWTQAEKKSLTTVREALVALENKDFVLLADILEYDLTSSLQIWLETLQHIGKGLNIESGSGGNAGNTASNKDAAGSSGGGRKASH